MIEVNKTLLVKHGKTVGQTSKSTEVFYLSVSFLEAPAFSPVSWNS